VPWERTTASSRLLIEREATSPERLKDCRLRAPVLQELRDAAQAMRMKAAVVFMERKPRER
jgi:hypothetical protein